MYVLMYIIMYYNVHHHVLQTAVGIRYPQYHYVTVTSQQLEEKQIIGTATGMHM